MSTTDAKLAQFESQLRDVERLLALEPSNAEFLALEKDLLEVIKLTKNLAQVQHAPSSAEKTAGMEAQGNEKQRQQGQLRDGQEEEGETEGEFRLDKAAPLPTASSESSRGGGSGSGSGSNSATFEVGSIVEAQYNGSEVWYPVHVLGHDISLGSYNVQFLTFEQWASMTPSQLRPLRGVVTEHVGHDQPAGTIVAARYSVDRILYNARVERATPHGYVVLFTDYGNQEEVPAEWVTLDTSLVGSSEDGVPLADPNTAVAPPLVKKFAPGSGSGNSASKKRKQIFEQRKVEMKAKLRAIPESLKVRPEDSDAQKKKKKRIANRLKKQNRMVNIEIAQNDRASSWLKFAHKTKKKGAKGSLLKLRKNSIFASPTTIDGKVGVTGSGRGMTDFKDRKKYSLSR